MSRTTKGKCLNFLRCFLTLVVALLLVDWLTDLLSPILGIEGLAWFLALIASCVAGSLIDALIHTVIRRIKQQKSEDEYE